MLWLMRNRLKRWLGLGFGTGPLLGLLIGISTLSYAEPTEQSSQALRDLRERMAALQTQLDAELEEKDAAMADLAELTRRINTLNQALSENIEAQQVLENEVNQTQQQQSKLAQRLDQLLAEFTRLLLKGYPVKSQTPIKLLLNQNTPHAVARVWAYQQRLAQANAKLLGELAQEASALAAMGQALQSKNESLLTLKQQQQDQLDALQQATSDRRVRIDQISRQIASNTEALAALKEDEARLERVLQEAKQQPTPLPNITEPPDLLAEKGRLPMPTQGRVMVGYGQARAGSKPWRGWILDTEAEATVHSIGAGRVVYADWLRGYGLLIIIDHQQDLLTLYAHNQTLFFTVGDWVRQGEVIAIAGQPNLTGITLAHGAYFELRHQGQAKDPAVWIDRQRLP